MYTDKIYTERRASSSEMNRNRKSSPIILKLNLMSIIKTRVKIIKVYLV